jgi:amino acid transporter
MTAESQPRSSAAGAFVQLIIAVILAGIIVVYFTKLDLLIDKIKWLSSLNMMTTWAAMGVLGFIAAVCWLNGHRALARAKGYSPLLGLVLGFVVIVGLLILAALPPKAKAAEAPAAEPAAPAESAPAEGAEQV